MSDEPILEVRARLWWQRPAVRVAAVVLAAGVLTLAVLALAGGWFGGGSPEPTSSNPVTLSPTEEATPSQRASPSREPATSERASPTPLPGYVPGYRPSIGAGIGVTFTVAATFSGATVSDVTAGGPGWVAVGHEGSVFCGGKVPGPCPGKIWSSADGRSWLEVAVPGLGASPLHGVASGPGGLVAVGSHLADDGQTVQLILFSPDGVTWTWLNVPVFAVPGTGITDLIGGSMFVATGWVSLPLQNSRPAIWISTNGRDWQEVFRAATYGSIGQVAVGGPGWVAVGDVYRPGGGERSFIPFPAVWVSADAATWTQRDLPLGTGATAGTASAVLNARPGLVAVGYAEYSSSLQPSNPINGFAAWRSTDGLTWTPAPVTNDFLEDIGGGRLLYESADRVFAIGSGCRCGGGGIHGRWWTTHDGLTWTEHSDLPPALFAVIRYGGGLLGVGDPAAQDYSGGGVILISD